MKIKLENGLNVLLAPEKIAKSFIKKLKVPKGYSLLENNTDLKDIKKRLEKKENIIVYSFDKEIINLANCLHGISNKEVISLKI